MATTVLPAPHFQDDSPSPRSFSPLPLPSRPSMEASSIKSRKSLLDIFVSGRRLAPAASGSKLKQSTKPAENMAIANADDMKAAPNREAPHKSTANQKAGTLEPAGKNPPQRPRSKSRTILCAISTTFRSRSPVSPTSPPSATTNPQAKQNREAALRERGLLPPRDLSRLEAEQDRHIPVVPLDRESVDDAVEPSAADLIKREWEAKHKSPANLAPTDSTPTEERERMKYFRFGSQSPKPGELAQAPGLDPVKEDQTPLPSPLSDDAVTPPPVPEKDSQQMALPPPPTEHVPSDPSPGPPVSPLPTPPPTPSEPTHQSSPSISSPAARPSSPSSHPSQHDDVGSSTSPGEHNRSDSQKSSLSAPPTPVISLTSPTHANSTEEPVPSSTVSSPHKRSESLTKMPSISETASSLMTPSLDTSSRTTATISTVSTSESQGATPGVPKGKSGLLKVKTPEHLNNIPMIIESPVEDSPVAEPDVNSGEIPPPLSPVSEGHGQSLAVPTQTPPLTRRGRGFTDPGKQDKRRSFNPFRRVQTAEPDKSGAKRISVVASFGNLRRAASNFTRPRSTYDAASVAPSSIMSAGAKTYDASHLPPSPTLPSKFNLTPGAGTGVGGKTSMESRLAPSRRAVQPTLHSRGSILMETSAIKDDEVRRMTELAFLG